MANLLTDLAWSARPRQWLKNLSLFAALVFSGNLFDFEKFLIVTFSAIIFSILASSIYLLNDIADVAQDRLHPFKKFRPIAKGTFPAPLALFISTVGIFVSLYLSLSLSFFFFLLLLFYFLLQLVYSFFLKNIVILDVLLIAGSFILRVYAGAVVIGVHLSVWFLLCVTSLALFLSVGKRRAEIAILAEAAPTHRKTLALYPLSLLDDYLSMFASSTWLSWALFTFFEPPPPTPFLPILIHFPLTFAGIGKWLMITIPIVIYGVMRYLKIIYEGGKAESPEKVLLSDKPLLLTVTIWGILVVAIIYGASL
ncbi:MAG: UbiA family prenyltransferase [Patescibacteria group bacterium]